MSQVQQFLAQFSIRHPIIQAPMAGVSTAQLAAAVSNAGALGSLGIGAMNAVHARQLIEETSALTEAPFNVNVFCHPPAQRDAGRELAWLAHLEPLFAEVGSPVPAKLDEVYASFLQDEQGFRMLLELRPAVVSFHFGLPPTAQLSALRQAGIRTMATATTLHEARLIEQAGIAAVVAQGIEAGGHRGMFDQDAVDERLSTAVLVRLLATQTSMPVIAAGGIMDGAGIRAMLELGACAAQLGTAFILCPESSANAAYRDALKSGRAGSTRLTRALSGRPARGLSNRFMMHAEAPGSPLPAAYPVAYDAAKQLNTVAARLGKHEFAAHWAGQGAALAREMPAAALLQILLDEMQSVA